MNATTTATATIDITKMNAADLRDYLNNLRNEEMDLDDAKQLAANQKTQVAVVAQIKTIKANRSNELTAIQTAIQTAITTQGFGIKELFGDNAITKFGDEDITAEAKHRGLFNAKVEKPAKEKGTRGPIVHKVFASDNNQVFIDIPKSADDHQRVVDVVIKQGRINEPYNGKSGPAFASIGKPALRVKGKDIAETEKNLAKFIVQESKEFAKTAEGKAELTKIATAIFNYVDPKAKDAEPHNEAQAAMAGQA